MGYVEWWQSLSSDAKLVNPQKVKSILRGFICRVPYNYRYAIWVVDEIHLVIFYGNPDDMSDIIEDLRLLCANGTIKHHIIQDVTWIVDVTEVDALDVNDWESIDTFVTSFNLRRLMSMTRRRGRYVLLQTR